jgi:hypothetical protein
MKDDNAYGASWGAPVLVFDHLVRTSQHPQFVSFNRLELRDILTVYGRKVARGEWRDYAIDMLKERSVFSIYRRSGEHPLYRVEKNPRLANRQGAYSVATGLGQVLKRGHDLAKVLRILEREPKLVQM